MITFMARLLGGSTIAAWLLLALAGAGAVGGAYWWADHQGYTRASTEAQVRYDKRELAIADAAEAERKRQADANTAAKANELARIKEMNDEMVELQSKIREQANEADQDPDRDRIGLSADSVRRLDAIRRTK